MKPKTVACYQIGELAYLVDVNDMWLLLRFTGRGFSATMPTTRRVCRVSQTPVAVALQKAEALLAKRENRD